MTTKDKVKKAMSQVDNILSSLCDENAALKKRNEYLEAKIGKIEDTEEVLRTVMKEKNKWWFLDSIEESVYRNVIEVIQKMQVEYIDVQILFGVFVFDIDIGRMCGRHVFSPEYPQEGFEEYNVFFDGFRDDDDNGCIILSNIKKL